MPCRLNAMPLECHAYDNLIRMMSKSTSDRHHTLKNGSYYHITNRQKELALTYTCDSEKPQLLFLPLNQTSSDQIWMVEQVKPNHYEIVHAYSTLVLTVDSQSAKMEYGSWKASQLFFVQKSDPKNNDKEYWIKTNQESQLYLVLGISLKISQTDPKANKCRWQLKSITDKNQVLNSSLIQFAYSGFFLDLPGSSLQAGTQLIQYKLNSRCNQRWKLTRFRNSDDYLITSVRSKMCLSVKGGKQKKGAAIVQQAIENNCPGQLWKLSHQGLSLYIIASKLKEGLYLGVQRNEMNEQAKIVLTSLQAYAFWRIHGPIEKYKDQ